MKNNKFRWVCEFEHVEPDHPRRKILSGFKSFRSSGAKNPRIIRRQKIWMERENNGIIKIEALRKPYARLKWATEDKKYLEHN